MTEHAPEPSKPRWLYRFDNYKRAFGLLREAMDIIDTRPLTQLEKEGVIQRFEYTWELAWKTIKDYMEHEGVVLDKITPASVLRAAFEAHIITNGEVWMLALDARNKLAHSYSLKHFETVIEEIRISYFALFDDLHMAMMDNAVKALPIERKDE
jgi:nucleotidyltransferase substrate binding protein (TIGR01987 family)